MKLNKKLIPMAVAGVMSMSALMAASAAQAETSATIGVSNMYLWRGQNLSPTGGHVNGGIAYKHESGGYAGMWTGSETGGHETDLYLGYGATVGGVGIDLSYWEYLYPEDNNVAYGKPGNASSMMGYDASEYVLAVSYGPVKATAYINAEGDQADNKYFTLAGTYEKFNLTYGWWNLKTPGSGLTGADEYSHLTFSYAATDELSISVSKAFSKLDAGAASEVDENPLFAVSYTKSFSL
jgi:uncharacterized protein (TIGR02001 family)